MAPVARTHRFRDTGIAAFCRLPAESRRGLHRRHRVSMGVDATADDALGAAIDRCCLMNGGLELVVFALARTESFQRSEPNRLLRRNLSVELVRSQHIERPLRDVE